MSITFDPHMIQKLLLLEMKPSIHACKIFFNYSKLCVISFFAKKVKFYYQNTLTDAFRTNSRNIIGRNPSMVIPLPANQDLTPMLVPTVVASTHYFVIM